VSIFAAYAAYYDLLYRDKNYDGEAEYVATILRETADNVHFILDLGCGTGAHATALARAGYEVHGVDLSSHMLAAAEERKRREPTGVARALSFSDGDVRTVRLDRKFDAVISLFHVFSYQTSNDDLRAVFETALAHLRPGGILLFDCWYGPAVLTIRPAITVKRLEDDVLAVTRIAEPFLDVNANTVRVDYDVIVTDKATAATHRIAESHLMRYLFTPEVRAVCSSVGAEFVDAFEWMGGAAPSSSSWAACYVARA
jgi:SAM-dependent methyltransferase